MNKIKAVLLFFLTICGVTLLSAHPKFTGNSGFAEGQYSPARADSAHGFDVTKYTICIKVFDQTHYIGGDVYANVTATAPLTEIDYNLVGYTVVSVMVNDTTVTYTYQNGIIHINYTASAGQQFVTRVAYEGTPQLSNDVYHIGMIFGANTVYTISDPDAGRYWWPSYDHPWDKAIVDLYIAVRDDWNVASNGLRLRIDDLGDGFKQHIWLGSNPMATYLVCFTAGPFQEINQTAGIIPIKNFVTAAQYNNAVTDFSTLPAILQFYETQFGAYPFEKYGNAVINMTTYGAMEHQTMTTLGQQYITGNHSGELTIAHELAHSWYGNCLTPLTFKDVWLSEGFATYAEMLWLHKRDGWQAACNYMSNNIQQYYINWENSAGAQVIYDPAFNNYFNPQSYEKAGSVLHMLRLKIGNANFFQLLQNWFTTYHNGNVITAEFQAMAEQISGQDLDQFFSQWIYQGGIPSVEYTVFSHQDLGRVKVIAKTSSPTSTQFHLEIPLALAASPADSVIIKASPAGFINDFPFNANADLSTLNWDPNHWVLARQHTTAQLQLTQCLGSNGSVLLNWNAFTNLIPLAGYNIWRKLPAETVWTLVNTGLIDALSYIDTSVINGTSYQYRITAEDASAYQSLPSNMMTAIPLSFPFDWGLLVVDETKDGNGTALSPTDAMVDNFYADAINPISYTAWDYAAMGAPTLNALSHYPIVLWHADDFSQNLIGDNLNSLGSYLLGGGKLIISGWKTPAAFTAAFTNLFMPNVILNYNNANVLVSAQSNIYPVLTPDPNKLTPTWNGILPMVYTFQNAQNTLYTASMVPNTPGHGEPLAARFDNNGILIVFGFPLYCMQSAGVRALLQQLLPELEPTLPVADNTVVAADLSLTCSPNPFRDKLIIAFNQKLNPHGRLKVYNTKGQLVNTIDLMTGKSGANSLEWTARDEHSKSLPAGLYLLHYNDGMASLTRKVVIIK
jgi:hypothetical protein